MGAIHHLERRCRATAPDGRVWTVRRRVLRRTPTWVGWGFGLRPFRTEARTTTGWGNYWAGIALIIAVVMFGTLWSLAVIGIGLVVLVAVWTFVVPPVVWAIDCLVVATVAVVDLGARTVVHTPWIVEATEDAHPARGFARTSHRWYVVGDRASTDAVSAVAGRITAGGSIRLPATAGRPLV